MELLVLSPFLKGTNDEDLGAILTGIISRLSRGFSVPMIFTHDSGSL
jgi:hypothetical protein